MTAAVIIAALMLTGGLLALLLMLLKKHRLIWNEIFKLRAECDAQRSELVNVRKQLVIEIEGHNTRLPLLIPSQNGEDLLLWNYFGRKRNGFYVEVGAYDGVGFSNTYFFEALGWRGILVEPVPDFYQKCLAARPGSKVINAVAGQRTTEDLVPFTVAVGGNGVGTLSYRGENPTQLDRIRSEGGSVRETSVPMVSLDDVLSDHDGPIDFVSIDVEGSELEVLKGFNLQKFQPRVLVIEDNTGGSDPRVNEYLFTQGYKKSFQCAHNEFYTRTDDSGVFSWTEMNGNHAN